MGKYAISDLDGNLGRRWNVPILCLDLVPAITNAGAPFSGVIPISRHARHLRRQPWLSVCGTIYFQFP
jgi:hypothetical protein